MPGTRYSATFDRTYVEESPPPHSPVRFSIQSWQGANLPGNPPLNGSYKHHARTASTDSLDSSGTGASSSSSGSGTGHSRQVSMEGPGETLMSTRSVIKTPTAKTNPLQFVKVGPVPLYKKAEEQIRKTKDVKVTKESGKGEEEQWQNNLDSWKCRRKKLSEKAIQRVEDLKLLEQDEQQQVQRKSRTKTFSEMMENRAQKPRGYNLAIYVENENNDFSEVGNSETNENKKEDADSEFSNDKVDTSEEQYEHSSVTENNHKNQPEVQSNEDHISNVTVNYECAVYSDSKNGHGTSGDEPCSNSKDSSEVCVEDDCNGCGLYTIDSGLESFSSSQRAGDIQDSSSELSVDSSGGYERSINDDETEGHSNIHQGESSDLLRDINLITGSQQWPQDLKLKDGHVQLNLRLWLNSETKDKDFGFSVQEENNCFIVDSVKSKSAAWRVGLQPKDQILALNGEITAGRSKNSILFTMKQSIYNGHLDLLVSRNENENSRDRETCPDDSLCEPGTSSTSVPGNAVSAIKCKLQNGHSFDDTWKDKNASDTAFRSRSKSESSRTWEEQQSSAMKKQPPPVPAKPKLPSKPAPTEATSHAPIVRTISNEMKLERMCSAEPYKFMAPDGVTDISKEMCDTEDELNQELIVYSETESVGGEPADLVFCVEQDTVRVSPVSSELQHRNLSLEKDEDVNLDYCEKLQPASVFEDLAAMEFVRQTSESEPSPQMAVPLHHVKEDNGMNIIFESHPLQSQKELSTHVPVSEQQSDTTPIVSDRQQSVVEELQVAPQKSHQGVLHEQQDVEEVLLSLVSQIEEARPEETQCTQDVETDLKDDSQESEWVQEELSNICPPEPAHELNSLLLAQQHASTLHPDDQLLVDLESHASGMEPPKEKPPPPPPADSPEQIPKMNTFKRVKKDLWKRRSDFLGIDPAGDEIDVDVPPPPDLSEILKSELDLERQNRLWLEKERFLSSGSSSSHERTSSADSQVTDEEIARKEKEIIENLEREEKAKHAQNVDKDDQELVAAESQAAGLQNIEDERIVRLQEERRRMEEERFQREELRIRAEEDRIFKEREEVLRLKEDSSSVEMPNVKPCPQFTPILANPSPSLNAVCKDSRPVILPKPNRLSRNLDRACSEPQGKENGIEKEALELEREKLLWEQERLQKEKEEYRRQVELEQRRARELKLPLDSRPVSEKQGSDKAKSPNTLSGRDAVIFASKKPQGLSDMSPEKATDFSSSVQGPAAQGSDVLGGASAQNSQQMNRNALHFFGAAPKARIIQSEQWINQLDPAAKRRTEPAIVRDRGYNQNHWLVQEAEMRRITEQNERQHQRTPNDQRRHSGSSRTSPGTGSGVGVMAQGPPSNQVPRHITSTAPRPYQRPPPPPPPKPPHGMPVQMPQPEQPWNYRPIAPVGMAPRASSDKSFMGDLHKFHSESVLGVSTGWTVAPAETKSENVLSVSGKERCSHCAEPLGRGGAMIIESLQLYYHMHCFCCCVCQAPLGNGTCGTDVRVRNHKLHCQNCYSNDEAGLKFSQV